MTTNSSKKRINILDLIVVLVVILVVALGAYVMFGNNDKPSTVSSNVSFTIEATRLDEDILEYIKEGQRIYDSTTKKELGTVVSIQEKPSQLLVENHDVKKIELKDVPDKIDVLLEVEAKAQMEYPNLVVGTVSLKIGNKLFCTVGDAAVEGVIIGLDYDVSRMSKKGETK